MVDSIIDLIKDRGIKVTRQVAESILNTADFVFDLVEAKGGIGEQNGLIFNSADFILDFVETKDIAIH